MQRNKHNVKFRQNLVVSSVNWIGQGDGTRERFMAPERYAPPPFGYVPGSITGMGSGWDREWEWVVHDVSKQAFLTRQNG